MFSEEGLALMLLAASVVAGRTLPAGSVGTEEDFGDELEGLLREGKLLAFDPRHGIPPVPCESTDRHRRAHLR